MMSLVLKKLRNRSNVAAELEQMYVEATEMSNQESVMSIMQVLKDRTLRLPLLSGVILQMAQQLCGINAVNKNSYIFYDFFCLKMCKKTL